MSWGHLCRSFPRLWEALEKPLLFCPCRPFYRLRSKKPPKTRESTRTGPRCPEFASACDHSIEKMPLKIIVDWSNDLENCFHLDCDARRQRDKSQGTACVVAVCVFTKHLVEQV